MNAQVCAPCRCAPGGASSRSNPHAVAAPARVTRVRPPQLWPKQPTIGSRPARLFPTQPPGCAAPSPPVHHHKAHTTLSPRSTVTNEADPKAPRREQHSREVGAARPNPPSPTAAVQPAVQLVQRWGRGGGYACLRWWILRLVHGSTVICALLARGRGLRVEMADCPFLFPKFRLRSVALTSLE